MTQRLKLSKVATKTDNTALDVKVRLRLDNLPRKRTIKVLDLFAGDGLIWQRIKESSNKDIEIVSIDKKRKTNRLHLVGDNLKFLQSIGIENFDVIDLDAYGCPYKPLKWLLRHKLKRNAIIHVTFIQSQFGALPHGFLIDLGYTKKMVKQVPTLFYRNGLQKLLVWLSARGIKSVKFYSNNNRKHYLCFRIGE